MKLTGFKAQKASDIENKSAWNDYFLKLTVFSEDDEPKEIDSLRVYVDGNISNIEVLDHPGCRDARRNTKTSSIVIAPMRKTLTKEEREDIRVSLRIAPGLYVFRPQLSVVGEGSPIYGGLEQILVPESDASVLTGSKVSLPATMMAKLEDCIISTLDFIFSEVEKANYKRSVREISLICWATEELMETIPSPHDLRSRLSNLCGDYQKWIVDQKKEGEGRLNWESEAWDTALAVISLCNLKKFADERGKAVHWLEEARNRSGKVWYDEVWETVLSVVALLRESQARRGPKTSKSSLLVDVLRWFNDIPSKGTGEFISPHYTGFLVWLLAEMSKSDQPVTDSNAFSEFEMKANHGLKWITSKLEASQSELWSGDTFANSYIIYACEQLKVSTFHSNETQLEKIINWYAAQPSQPGCYEDVEDSALAVLALNSIYRRRTDGNASDRFVGELSRLLQKIEKIQRERE